MALCFIHKFSRIYLQSKMFYFIVPRSKIGVFIEIQFSVIFVENSLKSHFSRFLLICGFDFWASGKWAKNFQRTKNYFLDSRKIISICINSAVFSRQILKLIHMFLTFEKCFRIHSDIDAIFSVGKFSEITEFSWKMVDFRLFPEKMKIFQIKKKWLSCDWAW